MSARLTGILLMLFSALTFSTAGLFTKSVDASAWNVVFWRGLFGVSLIIAYSIWKGNWRREIVDMPVMGWMVALIAASGTAAFIPAFKLTPIANVALIYASAPMIASLIAWLWMREKPKTMVLVGAVIAIVGVTCIVSGSLVGVHLSGDLLALWMTLAMSTVMVIYRRFPSIPAAGPFLLSSLILLPIALVFDDPFEVPVNEIMILAVFGLVFSLASLTLAEGAKRLPSGETALLSILEAPFAVVLAALILVEIPPFMTIVGGGLILFGVLLSQIHASKRNKNMKTT